MPGSSLPASAASQHGASGRPAARGWWALGATPGRTMGCRQLRGRRRRPGGRGASTATCARRASGSGARSLLLLGTSNRQEHPVVKQMKILHQRRLNLEACVTVQALIVYANAIDSATRIARPGRAQDRPHPRPRHLLAV